jgi:alpha-1,2-mannosyltransferase
MLFRDASGERASKSVKTAFPDRRPGMDRKWPDSMTSLQGRLRRDLRALAGRVAPIAVGGPRMPSGSDAPQSAQVSPTTPELSVPVPVIAFLAILSTGAALAVAVLDGIGHPVDFDIYRMGAADVLGSHLYDARLAHSLMGGARGMHFTYPPFAAFLFEPFTWLSVTTAQVIWSILNVLALAALAAITIRAVRPDLSAKWAWTAAAIALLPLLRLDPDALTVAYGQINFFVVLLVVLDLTTTLRRGRLVLPRGVLLGIAAAVKLTPLIFIPYLFLTRQFKAGITALATFLACGFAAFAIAPHSSWSYWSAEIFDTKRDGNLLYVSDQNLHSALQRLLGGSVPVAALGLLTVLFAIGGLAVATWAYRASSPMLGVLVCAVTGLIISPVSWAHHYVWIVPVLAWLILGRDRPGGGVWWALAAAILFWAAPIWWVHDLQSGYGGPLTILEGNAFFLAVVSFLILASILLWRRNFRPTFEPGMLSRERQHHWLR